MTKRKFYKTIVQVEVLSEEPLPDENSLEDIAFAIKEGDCSGVFNCKPPEILNGKQMADALYDQGSDPSFFQIDETGEDIE